MPSPKFLAVAVLAAVLPLSACGSSGTQTGPGAQRDSTKNMNALAFSRCMRSHGVPNFPDPQTGGGLVIQGGPGSGLDPNSPAFQSAQQACRSLLPNGGRPSPPSASQRAALLQFSACMRSHGLTNFPDPQFNANGTVGLRLSRSSGLDPRSPAFQTAQRVCAQYQRQAFGKAPGP